MNTYAFMLKDFNNDDIGEFVYYDKQIYILTCSVDYNEIENNQIEKIINFYRVKNSNDNLIKETILNYQVKTQLYKNYISVLAESKPPIKKDPIYNSFIQIKETFKNKEKLLNYHKDNEKEYIKRALIKLCDLIRDKDAEEIKLNNKYRLKLEKYTELLKALDNLKTRRQELFILKLRESTDQLQKEHLRMFLKWTKTAKSQDIKQAILYYLNRDIANGLNLPIIDFINDINKNAQKWERKLYYRDLYLSLYDKYLKETNGDQEQAKKKAVIEIQLKHTRPKRAD